jgi:pimeloyl-ACP methyl ester carboxylesterase
MDTLVHHLDLNPRGAGLPLLMLHGTGGLSREMEISGLPALLEPDRRVLVPDRPGYGATIRPPGPWSPEREAALFAAFLDGLGIGRVIVVGHSWATFTALAMAIAQPSRVAGVVLMSGYYFDDGRLDLRLAPVMKLAPLRRLLFASVLRPFARWLIRQVFAPNPVPDAFRAFPLALVTRPAIQRAMVEDATAMRGAARRLAPLYRSVAAPALVMIGSEDRMVDPAQSERVAGALAHAGLHRAEGVGHMIHHVATRETADAIARFAGRLDGLEPAPPRA